MACKRSGVRAPYSPRFHLGTKPVATEIICSVMGHIVGQIGGPIVMRGIAQSTGVTSLYAKDRRARAKIPTPLTDQGIGLGTPLCLGVEFPPFSPEFWRTPEKRS